MKTRLVPPSALLLLAAALAPSASAENLAFADQEIVLLENFEVTGTRPQAVDTTALKLASPIVSTPRAVTVIDSSRIREQDFQIGSDLLNWVPGFNTNGNISGNYHFYARGFRMTANEWRIDGLAGRVIGGSYSPNLFGVEAVTFLKGPAGLLYGSTSAPGGIVNLVTKKPRDTAATSLETRIRTMGGGEVGFGDRLSTEVELDTTGPLTADKRLLYRFLASAEHTEHPARGHDDDNEFYRLSFTAKLDSAERFVLTPMIEWSREERSQRDAVISPSSSRTTNDGRTDYTFADISPRSVDLSAGGRTDKNLTAGLDFNAKLTNAWLAQLTFRHLERDYTNNAWAVQTATLAQPDAADPLSWTVRRRHTRNENTYAYTGLDFATSYELRPTDSVRSLFQLGLNARRTATTAASGTGANQSPINIYTGLATAPLVANVTTLTRANDTESLVWNAYLQNQTELFSRLTVTTGIAFARERTETTVPATGSTTRAPDRDSDLTPNVGLLYRVLPAVSIYTSYSTSYTHPDPTYENAAGARGSFSPTEGENYEAGVKAEFWGNLLAASASVFRTELNGVLVQSAADELNPAGNRFYRQLDTGRRADGVELEFTVTPVESWATTFTYAYLDAYNRNLDGSRGPAAEMTPRHALSVYSRYTLRTGPLANLTFRGGFIWQDERWGGSSAPTAAAPDPLRLRAYHRIDFGVSYPWHDWVIALNIENLTDEYYLLAGNTGLALSPANPRSYALRLTRTW